MDVVEGILRGCFMTVSNLEISRVAGNNKIVPGWQYHNSIQDGNTTRLSRVEV